MLRRFAWRRLPRRCGLALAARTPNLGQDQGVPRRPPGWREHAGSAGALRQVPAAAGRRSLGMPVKLFPAADYAGVMQGIAAGQLEAAEFGASGFAGAWLDCKCLEPVVVPTEKDGSTYYYSVMVVRANSGIKTLEDMKGHSLAWADPNSTSGYLIPSATLKAKGIKLDDGVYFSKTGFSGGHEQGVVAVLNKQYDACGHLDIGPGREVRRLHARQYPLDGRQEDAEDVGHQHHLAVGQDPQRSVDGAQRAAGRAEEDSSPRSCSTCRSRIAPSMTTSRWAPVSATRRRRWSCTTTSSSCGWPSSARTGRSVSPPQPPPQGDGSDTGHSPPLREVGGGACLIAMSEATDHPAYRAFAARSPEQRRARRTETLLSIAILVLLILVSGRRYRVLSRRASSTGLPKIGEYFGKLFSVVPQRGADPVPVLSLAHLFGGVKEPQSLAYWFYRIGTYADAALADDPDGGAGHRDGLHRCLRAVVPRRAQPGAQRADRFGSPGACSK